MPANYAYGVITYVPRNYENVYRHKTALISFTHSRYFLEKYIKICKHSPDSALKNIFVKLTI